MAHAIASVTSSMIVEGVFSETGYHGYAAMLRCNELMPGMQQVVAHLRRDESRLPALKGAAQGAGRRAGGGRLRPPTAHAPTACASRC
jgi:ribonucleotide reductase beta subunit family protein with ferritin-like domain